MSDVYEFMMKKIETKKKQEQKNNYSHEQLMFVAIASALLSGIIGLFVGFMF